MFIREFNKCLNILSVSFYCHSLWSIKTLSSTLTTAFWWELKYKVWDWESRELASCFIYKGRWYQGLFIWFLPIGNAYLSVSFPCSHVQIVCMHAYGHIYVELFVHGEPSKSVHQWNLCSHVIDYMDASMDSGSSLLAYS